MASVNLPNALSWPSSSKSSPAARSSARRIVEANEAGTVARVTVPIVRRIQTASARSRPSASCAASCPACVRGVSTPEVYVGGDTAEELDYHNTVNFWLPLVLTFVLGLSFLLLTLAFRSIVVPATAIGMNLLVGAAYGLLVLVFQDGIGNELLGLRDAETIDAWVPLFPLRRPLRALDGLPGLCLPHPRALRTDGRHGRRHLLRHRLDRSPHHGAALIIIAVFWGFAMGDTIAFQQMGFGVALALLIDATIVRSVLVPATMKLLGVSATGTRLRGSPGSPTYTSRALSHGPGDSRRGFDRQRRPQAQMRPALTNEFLEEARRYVRRKRIFYTVLAVWISLSLMWLAIDLLDDSSSFWFYWPMLGT